MSYRTVNPATGETGVTFGFGRELSDLGFGEFVNRKLVNVAPAGAPPWGPVPA